MTDEFVGSIARQSTLAPDNPMSVHPLTALVGVAPELVDSDGDGGWGLLIA